MDSTLAQTLWGYLDTLVSFGKAAFGLGIVIFVHELGHFLVAKACGVKCEKFYIGFDVPLSIFGWKLPSALFRRQWGETEYGIGVIPLGGYVKMLGQDDNPANAAKEAERIKVEGGRAEDAADALDPRSYPAKSVPQRMAIISAGVIMNVIFAVVFAAVAYKMGVKYLPCELSAAAPGSPAWRAGIQAGDKILQLGKEGVPDEQLSWDRDLVYAVHKTMATQPLDVLVRRRNGDESWLSMKPRKQTDEGGTA
ncbi:MAG TPA: site-2 protease family protein, partial [Pirellulaceae bacterium]